MSVLLFQLPRYWVTWIKPYSIAIYVMTSLMNALTKFIRSRTASHLRRVSMGSRLLGLDRMSINFFILPNFSCKRQDQV